MQVEKTAVCSRSVANCFDLTNYRSKNQKVIMHHTQGLEQGGGYKPQPTAQCNDDDHCLRQKQGGVVGAAF